MVDGILASCYPSVTHDLSEIGMTPMQWFAEAVEWIFGEENGLQGFAIIAENLGKMIHVNDQHSQNII